MQETASIEDSIVDRLNRNCLGCKIVGGLGLIGSGLYVSYHSKKCPQSFARSAMSTIGVGLMILGTARVLDLPPFHHHQFNHG